MAGNLRIICAAMAALMAGSAAQADGITAEIGGLVLTRSGGDGVLFYSEAGPPAIDSYDLNGDYALGGELALRYAPGDWGVEARGLWLDQLSGSHTYYGDADEFETLTFGLNPVVPYGLPDGEPLTATLETDFSSLSLSALYQLEPGIELFAGPRFVWFDEMLNLHGEFGLEGWEDDGFWAENRMLGAEFGATIDFARLSGSDWKIRPVVRGSVGVYRNKIDGRFAFSEEGETFAQGSDSTTETALSLEAEFRLNYQASSNVSVFLAYRAIYIDGLATAPAQLKGTDYSTPSFAATSSDILLHGPKAGLVVRF